MWRWRPIHCIFQWHIRELDCLIGLKKRGRQMAEIWECLLMKLPADQYYMYIFVCLKSQRCSNHSHIRQNSSVFVTLNLPRTTSGKKYWLSSPDLLYVNGIFPLTTIANESSYSNESSNLLILLQPITATTQEGDKEILGAVSLESSDSLHDAGGIDLKKSSLKLVRQDKLDKQEFRERVKQKHREKRIKNKVKRKRYEVYYNAIEW